MSQGRWHPLRLRLEFSANRLPLPYARRDWVARYYSMYILHMYVLKYYNVQRTSTERSRQGYY